MANATPIEAICSGYMPSVSSGRRNSSTHYSKLTPTPPAHKAMVVDKAAPKMVLHYIVVPASRADRLFWLLEELGLPYEVKGYCFRGPTAPGMKEVTNLGKTPALEIDGKVYTETGFIVHHLLTKYTPNPDQATHLNARRTAVSPFENNPSDHSYFWSHFSEGTMMLHLQPARILGMGAQAMAKKEGVSAEQAQGIEMLSGWFKNGWVDKNVRLQLDKVEEFLSTHDNFSGTGRIGEGDFMMMYPLDSIAHGTRLGEYELGPATLKWVNKMRARPAWKRADERRQREDAVATQNEEAFKGKSRM